MQTTETNHLFPTYKRWDLTWNRADGSKIYANDQVFLDFMTGIGTVNMGHGHPAIIGAVEEQLHAGCMLPICFIINLNNERPIR